MKIYTKTGDQGTTSLLGGTRVPKYDLRIEAYGTVDELNAHLGKLQDSLNLPGQQDQLHQIQQQLFLIGSHLATDPQKDKVKLPELSSTATEELEQSIDKLNEELPPLRNFVLPGGHPANSQAHISRCVCRRAERRVVELGTHAPVNGDIVVYLNRLSDWLFVLSRYISFRAGVEERLWKS